MTRPGASELRPSRRTTTGYAVQVLPGLQDAVAEGDLETAERYRDVLLEALDAATDEAEAALPTER